MRAVDGGPQGLPRRVLRLDYASKLAHVAFLVPLRMCAPGALLDNVADDIAAMVARFPLSTTSVDIIFSYADVGFRRGNSLVRSFPLRTVLLALRAKTKVSRLVFLLTRPGAPASEQPKLVFFRRRAEIWHLPYIIFELKRYHTSVLFL